MTESEHLAAARRLQPIVMELRDRFDADRELPSSLVKELHAARLFRPYRAPLRRQSPQGAALGWLVKALRAEAVCCQISHAAIK